MAEEEENEHGGHRNRLRKRFLAEGMGNMEPHEILELILFYSLPQRDTSVLAHRLIHHFGSFSGVLEAPYEELVNFDGVSDYTAIFLKLILPLCNVYVKDKFSRSMQGGSAKALWEFTRSWFAEASEERLVAVLLGAHQEILFCDVIVDGPLTVDFDIKRLVHLLTSIPAAKVVLMHNHPNGLLEETMADRRAVIRTLEVLGYLKTDLQDYIIVTKERCASISLTRDGGRVLF